MKLVEMLPLELSNAIDRELASLSPDKLRNACFELTQRYAKGQFMETPLHHLAYIAARLPATYGAAKQVLQHIEPFLKPVKSLLDLGAGVGSFGWAAAEVMPGLKRITFFEKDIELLRLGQHLTQNNLNPYQLAWCRDDITKEEIFPSHDVVVLSYVLNELAFKDQLQVVKRSYGAADKFLILIEPGTPAGFGNILTARHLLAGLGAHILAPCTQNGGCPLMPAFKEGKDWCHFSVRIPRGRHHRQAKDAVLPYEDEKYSYLVVSPHPHFVPKVRVIKAPLKKSGHVILNVCTQKGKEERLIISKSEGKAYTQARDLEWGDEWEG